MEIETILLRYNSGPEAMLFGMMKGLLFAAVIGIIAFFRNKKRKKNSNGKMD